MRGTILLLILIGASATALGQPDPRTTIYKGPVHVPLPCRNQDLSVRHVTDDAAMGGLRIIDYAFRNTSSAPCTLRGYPRFELLDKLGSVRPRGRAINSRQLPGDEAKQPPKLVTIEPGNEAGFRVYHNSGGAGYVGKPCPVSRKVRITAPGTTRRFVLREEITSCGSVEVSAVRSELPQ
jgi:hypothetical protein